MSVTELRDMLDRAREEIGERYIPQEGKGISEVTEYHATDWSRGLEETAEHYFDADRAASLGLTSIRVPPSFITVVARGPSYDVFGVPDEVITLHGESEYEFLGDLKVGDQITAEAWISDVRETMSERLGPLGILKTNTEFRNQDGDVIAIHRWTSVAYSAAEAISRLAASNA